MEEDEAVDVSDEQEGTENSEMSSDDESNLMETDLPADPKSECILFALTR